MEDIKITLSRNQNLRSPSIEAEKEWLEKNGGLYYPLGRGKPKRTAPGRWVYFIRGGELVARSPIEKITPPDYEGKISYKGEKTNIGSWEIYVTSMELAKKRIPYRGFQGFRYVTNEEASEFEACF